MLDRVGIRIEIRGYLLCTGDIRERGVRTLGASQGYYMLPTRPDGLILGGGFDFKRRSHLRIVLHPGDTQPRLYPDLPGAVPRLSKDARRQTDLTLKKSGRNSRTLLLDIVQSRQEGRWRLRERAR